MIFFAAFMLGLAAGLRVFTAPAVLYLSRGGLAGIILSVVAVGEYIADALPQIPPRTAFPSILARPFSGAFCGWVYCTWHGQPPLIGALLGLAGALIGTYGGYYARLAAIKATGPIPAALIEDVVALAVAFLAVIR